MTKKPCRKIRIVPKFINAAESRSAFRINSNILRMFRVKRYILLQTSCSTLTNILAPPLTPWGLRMTTTASCTMRRRNSAVTTDTRSLQENRGYTLLHCYMNKNLESNRGITSGLFTIHKEELVTRAATRGSPSLGLPFRSISLSTTSQIGLPAKAFGYCYYENEAAHEVIKLLHHRCWMRKM